MADKKYLFICGCPRSGTTALWQLMVSHPHIVLGVERYIHLSMRKGIVNPPLFERTKFFDLQPGETFYSNLQQFNSYYADAEEIFDEAQWVGDKIPNLYIDYDGIEQNFQNAHLLYIVRNIIDVAGSYQARAGNSADATWNASRDYKRAVTEWHASIKATLDLLAKAGRRSSVQVVSYEELFLEPAVLDPIFAWLGVPMVESVHAQYRRLLMRSGELNARRGDSLNSAQRQYISLNAPVGLYRQLFEQRLALAPAAPEAVVHPGASG